MWTSTLEINIKKVLPTRLLGPFWRGAYFSSLAPLQVKNLPRQSLTHGNKNWVRVHNRLAGICGSDLHLVFADGDLRIAPAALLARELSYPGHEVVGEVVEIGEDVQDLHVGDRVVLQSAPNCLSAGVQSPCRSCSEGHYNLCENVNFPGPQQIGGGWSEEMLLHEQQLFAIPEEMDDEQAVLLEPTAVALHAVLRRPPQPGEKVLIVGAGTIGLLTLQVIHALAPQAEISVLARHDFQVEQATRLGATRILYSNDSYESVKKATGAKLYTGMFGNKMLLGGYDVIYDTVGSKQTIHHNLRWARAGGTVIIIGVSLHLLKLDLSPIWHQEVNLIGTTGHGTENWPVGTTQKRSTFALASDLITNGLIHPEKLITHRFALSNFREALQTANDKKGSRAIKVIFDAALLPASSIPNARVTAQPRRSDFQSGELLAPQITETDESFAPVSASLDPALSGPSHFTMAQSEDFTADFDNTQFIAPKPRRPPTPLQFRSATDDIQPASGPISPASVTNTPLETLPTMEGTAGDPSSASPN
jgi:2-desacetyl-2-hydroxyethyl bacteriochlorophyllide A dehydrogenase